MQTKPNNKPDPFCMTALCSGDKMRCVRESYTEVEITVTYKTVLATENRTQHIHAADITV